MPESAPRSKASEIRRCQRCDTQPALHFHMLDSRSGKTVRILNANAARKLGASNAASVGGLFNARVLPVQQPDRIEVLITPET
jgi:hypothetical protein